MVVLCSFALEPVFAQRRSTTGKPNGKARWQARRTVGGSYVINDPHDDGPDGFNHHDWDGDGDLSVIVNFEEGSYSRLYFNPGKKKSVNFWTDFIEFEKHGKCEDSGIGDLDQDGGVDYVANGEQVFFNPRKKDLRNPAKNGPR